MIQRLGPALSRALFNALPDHIERQIANQHGRGVLQGLELSISVMGGLKVDLSAGVVNGISTAAVAAIAGIAVMPDAAQYLWIDDNGIMSTSATPDDIGGGYSCLGLVTTNSSMVVSITNDGRMMPARVDGTDPRVIRLGRSGVVVDDNTGWVGIGKTPTAASFDVAGDSATGGNHVVAGELAVAGRTTLNGRTVQVGHLWQSVNAATLAGDLHLDIDDANYQILDPTGSVRKVYLPPNMDYQHTFRIACSGTAGRLDVIDADGSTVLVTINPGTSGVFLKTPTGGGGSHLGNPGGVS